MRRNHNTTTQTSVTRFALGQTFITPGAEEALQIAGQTAIEFLRRHMSCDWGELSEDDIAENELSLKQGFRLLSNYRTGKGQQLYGSSPRQTVAQLRSCFRPSTETNNQEKKQRGCYHHPRSLHRDLSKFKEQSQMPDQSTGVCAARTNAPVCNIHELVTELQERIEDGEPFDNPKLTRTADRVFGGSRAQGRYMPRDAYDAVEIAVNNHLLERHAGELMQMDVTEVLASVLRPLIQRLPRQTDRILEQTELQQFSTPPTLAYVAARLLDPEPTDIVLEPSAGTGSLAIWPRAVGAKVICNETSLRRFSLLRCVLNFDPFPLDAEFIDDLLPADIQPTAVLINPPFSSASGRVTKTNPLYGGRHLASALRRLKEGGRLVAIVSEAMRFHHPSFSEWWQRIACLCNIRANLTLNGKEYAKYGAAPDVQILVIDKTGATPGQNWQEQLKQISCGSAATLEDAWQALKHLVETAPTNEPDDDPDESEPSGN